MSCIALAFQCEECEQTLGPSEPGQQGRPGSHAAGLLTELSPEEKQRAAQSAATLEEVRAALDRAGGKPLSELILEMRGKE